jgi:small nuclear ribonucleoprotein (snRNP)-like protein
MTTPKDLPQIHRFIGKTVIVDIAGDTYMVGTLTFFNWEQQVVHISDYTQFRDDKEIDKGKFIIINQRTWVNVRVK